MPVDNFNIPETVDNEQLKKANKELQDKINELGSDTIMHASRNYNDPVESSEEGTPAPESAITGDSIDALTRMGYFRKTRPVVRDTKKISRNDPCPCGSGKKYKNCCLASGQYETTHFA